MGFLGGMYFWWPKVFGFTLSDKLGKWHFWLILIGFNLTFGPMHILGLQGMPRRMHTYIADYGFELWNLVATIGAFLIAVAMLVFVGNILVSWRAHRISRVDPGPDPWDARGLEWMVQSPAPAHNFDTVPTVSHLDEFWHRKYQENAEGKVVRVATGAEVAQPGDATGVHLPSPSYWPLVLAAALPIIAYGLIFNLGIAAAGGVLVILAGFGLGYEPSDDPEAHHGPHGDGHENGHAPPGDGHEDESETDSESASGAPATEAEPAGVTSTATASDEPTTGEGSTDG
jgi:cytochrome c oxidase subunit 1